jgi:SAM-dependent methyltransferase
MQRRPNAAGLSPRAARAVACRGQNLAIAAVERLRPFHARTCPCCGWSGLRFRSFAVLEYLRTGVICPGCGSFERHRALASFYPRFFERLGVRPSRLIHFSPEPCLKRVVAPLCDRYETSVYGDAAQADLRLDITRMTLPGGSCDALLLNHVLECIPDDRPAIAEMYRVLRRGGVVLAAAGFSPGVPTRDVPVQSNSVYRNYGSDDLAERFAPFGAAAVNAAEGLSADVRRTSGIPAVVHVLVLRK